MVENDEVIRALSSRFVITLCEISPFFSKFCCQYLLGGGICGEILVYCDRFTADGVDDGGTVWCSVPFSVGYYLAWRFLTSSFAWKLYVNRLRVSCVMKREVWMAFGRVVLGGVSFPCGVSFGMRRGERRRFFT